MDYFVYLAAAIPFLVIMLGLILLTTVRYTLTGTQLKVTLLGLTIRKISYAELESVEFFPPDAETVRRSLFRSSGVIVLHLRGGRTVAISPHDAEGFYEGLREKL